jgi:hypothetical protein
MDYARIKERVDRQHADIRRLIVDNTHKDDQLRTWLLREVHGRKIRERTPGYQDRGPYQGYETATAAQGDQQSQIVALHSQVRELQAVLSDAESKCTLLQNARRALQAELEGMGAIDANKISTGPDFQRLQLKKQDLE